MTTIKMLPCSHSTPRAVPHELVDTVSSQSSCSSPPSRCPSWGRQ